MKHKKILAFVLSLVILFGSIPTKAQAAAYTVSGNTATAVEGTSSWTAIGGTGTGTVDLKNGTLEWKNVQITPTSLGGSAPLTRGVTINDYTIDRDYIIGERTYFNYFAEGRGGYREEDIDILWYNVGTLINNWSVKSKAINVVDERIASKAPSDSNSLMFIGRAPAYAGACNQQPYLTEVPVFAANTSEYHHETFSTYTSTAGSYNPDKNLGLTDVEYNQPSTIVPGQEESSHPDVALGGGKYNVNFVLRTIEDHEEAYSSSYTTYVRGITWKEVETLEATCMTSIDEVQKTFNVPQVSNVIGAKQINNITLKNCSSNNLCLP